MRHVSTTILGLLSVGALLLAGCTDDGSADDAGRDGAGSTTEDESPSPPEEAPAIAGPVLHRSLYDVVDHCPTGGQSNHYPTTTRHPLLCLPNGEDSVGLVILTDALSDHERNGVFVTIKLLTDVLVSDGAGGWRHGVMQDISEGGEVRVWSRQDDPLEHTTNESFVAKTITYEPPTAPLPRPTRPLPWAPQADGTVVAVHPCPSVEPSTEYICATATAAVLVDDAQREGDLLTGVTSDTTILVHDGTAWVAGALDRVTPGAPVRVWTDDYENYKAPIPSEGRADVIAIGPPELW